MTSYGYNALVDLNKWALSIKQVWKYGDVVVVMILIVQTTTNKSEKNQYVYVLYLKCTWFKVRIRSDCYGRSSCTQVGVCK